VASKIPTSPRLKLYPIDGEPQVPAASSEFTPVKAVKFTTQLIHHDVFSDAMILRFKSQHLLENKENKFFKN
jgi:hypothetical protein